MLREGEWLSLNGSTGEVILGKQPLSPPALSGDLGTFMSWVDDVRKLKVKISETYQCVLVLLKKKNIMFFLFLFEAQTTFHNFHQKRLFLCICMFY